MKTITLAIALAALSVGAASAQPGGKADTNGDGKITRAEFKTSRLGMVMRADANKDGKVTKAEMEASAGAMRAKGGGEARPGGGRMFGMMDANGDGVITRAEAEAAADKRFKRMDSNNDGVVSAAELESSRRGPG